MRKLYALAVILLAITLSGIQPQPASAGVCPPKNASACVEVDLYVETCPGGARICTVYQCSGGASYTCCTTCEGPF
jgi:hypothetical protein